MILKPLDQKLLRDIWRIKGQMLAIMMVMACGITTFIMSFGVVDSLKLSQDVYYDRYQFADVFAQLKRAPLSVRQQIREIPGVSAVEARVVFGVTVQVEDMAEPATGKLISLPDGRKPLLNNLYLRKGRMLEPDEDDAILANEAFVKAHGFHLGDKVNMVINGHKRSLKIVGVVLSPEYVYAMGPGALFPDDKRFGIFWMGRRALEAAVDMDGAFNDVSVRMDRGADPEEIKQELDIILKPYGGLISYARADQQSHWFVENELTQLRIMGLFAPTIFLAVAAFLVNVVMTRQVATQREQIGMLKAVGYRNREIALHYLKMVLMIVVIGSLFGIAGGIWLGGGMTNMYTQFFHFPILQFSFSPEVMVFAVFFCTFAAVLGTLIAIGQAAGLPPAEAMRPESPVQFRQTLMEKVGLEKYFSHLTRIVIRHVERRPVRTLFSTLGIGLSMSILIFAFFMEDSIDYLMEVHFDMTQREDIGLSFVEPRGIKSLEEIRLMPGVIAVEPIRSVAVFLKSEHYSKRSAITGLRPDPDLHRILDRDLRAAPIPERGIALSAKLAEVLHVKAGDIITAEVLEERRPVLHIPVTEIVEEFIGLSAFMNMDRLNQYLQEGPVVTGAALMTDPLWHGPLFQEIKNIPSIASMNILQKAREIFKDTMGENILKMVATNIIFAGLISFGVIYNTARIALSERGRELASLRVLGLTRGEVAYLLFGEMALIILMAIPVGLGLGELMVAGMAQSLDTELFRVPAVVDRNTYGLAVLIVVASSILSFYLVWRQVENIDLVTAQKGVE
ncbi:ABC transporter permease [Paremcibacter congregatus]|uniref:ABC transporter permease n=1 Tax=Paremcibacter congregatus TaxID=2043170 RepID=UPI0030EB1868